MIYQNAFISSKVVLISSLSRMIYKKFNRKRKAAVNQKYLLQYNF